MNQRLSPPGDTHHEVALLLPWYVTDRLDAAERDAVDAHLATCEACRADLATERTLAAMVAAPQSAPEPDWERFARRLDAPALPASPRRRTRDPFAALRGATRRPSTLRWMVAGQSAAILLLGVALVAAPREAPYRVLGDAPTERQGNVLAMFRPQTSEAHFRQAIQASGARLVDGPTAAGAYVLDVPGGDGGGALAKLRRDPEVTMAEPIDAAPAE